MVKFTGDAAEDLATAQILIGSSCCLPLSSLIPAAFKETS